jgi:hypothetical protein
MTMDTTEGGSSDASATMTPPARQGSSKPFVKTMLEAELRSCESSQDRQPRLHLLFLRRERALRTDLAAERQRRPARAGAHALGGKAGVGGGGEVEGAGGVEHEGERVRV